MSRAHDTNDRIRTGLRSQVRMDSRNETTTSNGRDDADGQDLSDEVASSRSDRLSQGPALTSSPARDGPWTGWAEIENDPMVFSTLLEEWGVKAVQVSEVVPLDALFDLAPQSVYGLIFLSRWTSDDDEEASKIQPSTTLWFANQISTFSCATVALLNIINNHSEIELGPQLQSFRDITQTSTPVQRGLDLDKFQHVRDVHNSFAMELDKLCVDLRLKQDVQAAKKPLPKSRKRKRGRKGKTKADSNEEEEQEIDTEDDENGFHFVAYVPFDYNVWRMDGMERQPFHLGKLDPGDIWTAVALEDLQRRMESATANQLEFSLLSVGVGNAGTRSAIEREEMDRAREDWGPFISHMIRLHAEKGNLAEMLNLK